SLPASILRNTNPLNWAARFVPKGTRGASIPGFPQECCGPVDFRQEVHESLHLSLIVLHYLLYTVTVYRLEVFYSYVCQKLQNFDYFRAYVGCCSDRLCRRQPHKIEAWMESILAPARR